MGGRTQPPTRGPAAACFLHPHAAEVPHSQPISGSGAGFPSAFCLAATGGEEAGEASRKGQRGGAAHRVLHREGIEVFAVQSGTVGGRGRKSDAGGTGG